MKTSVLFSLLLILLGCLIPLTVAAQQSAPLPAAASANVVPSLISYGGVLKDATGHTLTNITGVTFLLYSEEQGGAPLWLETQNVTPDKTGHYTVQLGAMSARGLPSDLFVSGGARWLALQIGNEPEQARVLLVAVPYAMKSIDAQTLGGLPPSAFMLAVPAGGSGASFADGATAKGPSALASPLTTSAATTGGGTPSTIAMFTTPTDLENSILTQIGTSVINVAGKLNLPATGKATSSAGFNSQPQSFVATVFNGTAALPLTFQWQAEPVNNGQQTATGTLNLLFGGGGNRPNETGLSISNNGIFSFASGQTFPGAGTVTTVNSGAGLTGGPVTSAGTLSIAPRGVRNFMLQNSSLSVNPGTALVGGGAVSLGGSTTLNLDTSKVPLLAANNTFTGNQTVNGNLSATGVVTGSGFQIGSTLFDSGSYDNGNAFLGFAGSPAVPGPSNINNTASGRAVLYHNVTGSDNTASGVGALFLNNGDANGNGGSGNTAIGVQALVNNTTGQFNTAVGDSAGYFQQTGSNNTFLGTNSGPSSNISAAAVNNATAIGARSEVDTSNAMVLGSINGVNGALADTTVGIGITAPTARLHIGNTGGSPPPFSSFLRVEGPTTYRTGIPDVSIGGLGDFQIDAPGVPSGRFLVREDGLVYIGLNYRTTPGIYPFQIALGYGAALADKWLQYSSRRWKTNIHELTDALSKVERLRGVSYDLKASGKHEIGVIAEEVGEVVPELVSYEENGKDARGVDYSRLTALLIEAVKEQQKQITTQQTQIAAQQSQLRKQRRLSSAQQREIGRLSRKVGLLESSLRTTQASEAALVALK